MLKFSKSLNDARCTVELLDDLVAGASEEFVCYCEEIIHEEDFESSELYLDMTGLKYIDSAGISALLRLHRSARKAGIVLKVFGQPDNVHKILLITRVNRFLHLYRTLEEAISENADTATGIEEPLEFRMTIPGEYVYSRLIISFILNIMRDHFAVSRNDELNMRISLEESITNAIEHGYKDHEKSGLVMAWVMVVGTFFVVVIDDHGQGFNCKQVLEKMRQVPYNPFSDRGRGLFMINELMDELSMDSSGRGSLFVMAKSFKCKEKTA